MGLPDDTQGAQIRRTSESVALSMSTSGLLEIDTHAGVLRRDGVEVHLRRRTWELLDVLAAQPGVLLSRAELMQRLWPRVQVVDDSLTQCVGELRKALGPDGRLLRTVARRGYRLDWQPRQAPAGVEDAWGMLRSIDSSARIAHARRIFEIAYDETKDGAKALAGIALSHVIDVLNRWSPTPHWQAAQARQAADEAVRRDPSLALAHHARAHAWMLSGCYAQARAGFTRALQHDPSLAHAHLRLAVIAIETGRAQDARPHLQRALVFAPQRPAFEGQARFVEGMAAFHVGDDAHAGAALDRALQVAPGSAFAHQWKAALEGLHGQVQPAQPHLAAFCARVGPHTVESLKETERSAQCDFVQQRARFYDGLQRAGLALH